MIEAGRPRRLQDEAIVGAQLVEPDAVRRRGEKAPQSSDGSGQPRIVAGAPVHQIGAYSFGLRPQPRHRVMHGPVDQHRVDRDAAARVDAMGIGEGDQPRHRVGPLPAGELRPAIEQERPFVVVARLGDASFDARRRRPVRTEELAQRSRRRIDEAIEAKLCDAVRHRTPGRIGVDLGPRQRGLEQVHMRVGSLRQAAGAILKKAAAGMRIGLRERGAQIDRQPAPAARFAECAVTACIGEQRKGLVVEVECRIADPTVELDHRDDDRIFGNEVVAEITECVECCLAPRTVPPEPPGLAIRKDLPCNAARPMRPRQRFAVQLDRLMEAAADAVGADVPPQRQRRIEQPASQRRRLAESIAHAASLRGAWSATAGGNATVIGCWR